MTGSEMGELHPRNGEQTVIKDKTSAGREEQPEPSVEQQPPLDGYIDYSEMQELRYEIGELLRRITDFCISVIQRHGPGRN